MSTVKSLINGIGVVKNEVYYCVDFIRNADNTLTAVIYDSDGKRHFLNQNNYEVVKW